MGGGAAAYNSVQITATTFVSNSASLHGGGLLQVDPSQASQTTSPAQVPQGGPLPPGRLVNVLFALNTSPQAPDLHLEATLSNTLLHATFVGASQPITEAIRVLAGSLTVRNSLFTGYTTAIKQTGGSADEDYDLYFGGGATPASYLSGTVASGGHSLVADPLLVNAAGGDYHLTYASPARDAGLNLGVETDFDGDPRPYGWAPDIGFDELVGYPLLYLPMLLR